MLVDGAFSGDGGEGVTEPWLLDTQVSGLATEAGPSGLSWLGPAWFPPRGPLLQGDLNLSTAFPPSWPPSLPLIILFSVISSQQTSQCRITEKVTLRASLLSSTNIICGVQWVLETQEG